MLSISQMSVLNSCAREWVYRYVLREQTDMPAYVHVGRAFHEVVAGQATPDTVDLKGVDETQYPYRAALGVMSESYKHVMSSQGVPLLQEFRFEGTDTCGVVDGVQLWPNGQWSLVERKTVGRVDDDKTLTLHEDLQVATYVAHLEFIAAEALLNPKDFLSVLYTQTTRPPERRGKLESIEDYGKRLTSHTHVTVVPAERIRRDNARWAYHLAKSRKEDVLSIYAESENPLDVPGNTQNCIKFGTRCGFFERCHGETQYATYTHKTEQTQVSEKEKTVEKISSEEKKQRA